VSVAIGVRGAASLLAAMDGEPPPEQAHYEVVDAKLARTAKARAVAQTAFYSHLLADLQNVRPRWMHLWRSAGPRAVCCGSSTPLSARQKVCRLSVSGSGGAWEHEFTPAVATALPAGR
jgi:hypothetical protein